VVELHLALALVPVVLTSATLVLTLVLVKKEGVAW